MLRRPEYTYYAKFTLLWSHAPTTAGRCTVVQAAAQYFIGPVIPLFLYITPLLFIQACCLLQAHQRPLDLCSLLVMLEVLVGEDGSATSLSTRRWLSRPLWGGSAGTGVKNRHASLSTRRWRCHWKAREARPLGGTARPLYREAG